MRTVSGMNYFDIRNLFTDIHNVRNFLSGTLPVNIFILTAINEFWKIFCKFVKIKNEMIMKTTTGLNNAQLEILKMFSRPMSKQELTELKQTLIEFLAKKINIEVDEIPESRKITQKDLDNDYVAVIFQK